MDTAKVLTGEEIVCKGLKKVESSLPVVGLKDVSSNGSWLEQKQIQAALEAHKYLIEVERIEKCGNLSHAVWCDDLRLAEVTSKCGGHWKYMGHNVGKTMYLKPEEALYLIEANCLQLKYNAVTVSVQKAYSLLLDSPESLIRYRVYSNLSRLGYKVFRHKGPKDLPPSKNFGTNTKVDFKETANQDTAMELDEAEKPADNVICTKETIDETPVNNPEAIDSGISISNEMETNQEIETVTEDKTENNETVNPEVENNASFNNKIVLNNFNKLDKLCNRTMKPSDFKSLQNYFKNIPDLLKNEVVTVNAPEQDLIPRNVFVNKPNYLLNLENIKMNRFTSTDSTYTSSDEVETNLRIRSISGTEIPHTPNLLPQTRFPRESCFRPYSNWRPPNNLYYQFNMVFQRPSLQNMYFQSRFQYIQRQNVLMRSFSFPNNIDPNDSNLCRNGRKRIRFRKEYEMQNIRNMALGVKQIVVSGNNPTRGMEYLQALLRSFNMKYKTRLRISDNFDVVDEQKIIETIELDDDEESRSKKSRLESENNDKYEENLERLKLLADRYTDLESQQKATSRHRRAFAKAINTFNKTYNADIYYNYDTYEIVDKRHITLASSSESDCVVEEKPKIVKRKRLRNPFNILKRRSEKLENKPGTSKDNVWETDETEPKKIKSDDNKKYELLTHKFSENWLPSEEDFGRAEVVPKQCMNVRLLDSNKELFLYDFMKEQFQQYQSWLDAKIHFLRHLEVTDIAFQQEQARILENMEDQGIKPLLDAQDCSDMPSILAKLRIINNNKNASPETWLSIDFDVYNRDIQNYKKTNPPEPHFRIICVDNTSRFPSASDMIALHSKYNDNIPLVFAIVAAASISYLQINPIDLAEYIPKNEMV